MFTDSQVLCVNVLQIHKTMCQCSTDSRVCVNVHIFTSMRQCLLQVHTVIKRKWGQHRLMNGKSKHPRSTYFTQTSIADPPLMSPGETQSPRGSLYDNPYQPNIGNGDKKPHKSILKSKTSKPRKNGHGKENGCEYSLAERDPVEKKLPMENSSV